MMKARYILEYSSLTVDEPVVYNLVKNFDIKVNILRAEITAGHEGSMLVELEGEKEKLASGLEYLESLSVSLLPISRSLQFRQAECIDCGACTGVCFSGCLSMGDPDWKLVVDSERCIACGLCVPACPLGLFSLRFGA